MQRSISIDESPEQFRRRQKGKARLQNSNGVPRTSTKIIKSIQSIVSKWRIGFKK